VKPILSIYSIYDESKKRFRPIEIIEKFCDLVEVSKIGFSCQLSMDLIILDIFAGP
jgi:hypothetical protein